MGRRKSRGLPGRRLGAAAGRLAGRQPRHGCGPADRGWAADAAECGWAEPRHVWGSQTVSGTARRGVRVDRHGSLDGGRLCGLFGALCGAAGWATEKGSLGRELCRALRLALPPRGLPDHHPPLGGPTKARQQHWLYAGLAPRPVRSTKINPIVCRCRPLRYASLRLLLWRGVVNGLHHRLPRLAQHGRALYRVRWRPSPGTAARPSRPVRGAVNGSPSHPPPDKPASTKQPESPADICASAMKLFLREIHPEYRRRELPVSLERHFAWRLRRRFLSCFTCFE